MTIIIKSDEKFKQVIDALDTSYTDDDFVEKFKEMFHKDWEKVVRRYEKHERRTKPGKSHPMPNPKKYVLNISHKIRKG